jgi:hypothetical protein
LPAADWFSGKDANPKTIDLESGFTVKAKQEFVTSAAVESPSATEPATPTATKTPSGSQSDEVRLVQSNAEKRERKKQLTHPIVWLLGNFKVAQGE